MGAVIVGTVSTREKAEAAASSNNAPAADPEAGAAAK